VLKPDRPALRRILDQIAPSELVHLDLQTRQLFLRAVAALRKPHGVADLNALDVSKHSPSSPKAIPPLCLLLLRMRSD